jgi:hypothetical protein
VSISFRHWLQVSIVSLKKGGLQVRSHAWDDGVGGRDLDELIFRHFCEEFKQKFRIDIASNKKASFKLRVAVEKVNNCSRPFTACLALASHSMTCILPHYLFLFCLELVVRVPSFIFECSVPACDSCSVRLVFIDRCVLPQLKKMLSANAEAPIGIECIMEDTDVRVRP